MTRRTPLAPIFDEEPRRGSVTVGNSPSVAPPAGRTTLSIVGIYEGADITFRNARGLAFGPPGILFVTAEAGGAAGSGGLLTFDISDPTNPTVLNVFTDGTHLTTPRYCTLTGTTLVVTSSSGNRLTTIDVSTPASPVTLGSLLHAALLVVEFV